jgi:phage minor structural protein
VFIDIDYSRKKYKSKIQLAKPNKEIIANLSEKFNDNISLKFGNINELNFSIPHTINDGYSLKENPNIHMIKEKMLLKLINGTQSEWFIIEEISEDGDDDTVFNVLAYSLGYELSHKRISGYEKESIKCENLLTDLLKNTGWKIGTVDAKFINMSRAFENSSNSLEAVIQAGDTFGAIIEWNTQNRTISFRDIEDIGKFKGLSVNYGKLLKSISRTRTTDELVTRLYIYGNEDISIHSVNPTGQSYIEDFSFYMFPFERDANKNVLKKSHFMSDGLCNALLDQAHFLSLESDNIKAMVDSITAKQSLIIIEESELYGLGLDMESINYRLDTAKAVENQSLITQIEAEKVLKQSEINNQQSFVNQLKSELLTIQLNLESKRASILVNSNFTSELLEELNLFIIEREWRDDRYIDVDELYEGGLEKFLEMRMPKVVVTVGIENLFDIIEEQHNWNKLVLGDSVRVTYPQMNIEYMARIIEINQDFEGGDISVTLANTNTIGDEMEQLKTLLSKSQTASTLIQNSKHKLDKITYVEGELTKLINDEWNANKNKITAGVNNQIEIGSRGIIIRNPDMPNEVVIMQSGIIALSKDGGDTWKTAIKPDGIIAERLVGKVILGTRLIIEDENGIMRFSGSLQEIFNNEGVAKVQIGEYETGKYGMRIDNGAIEIVNGLPKSQLDPIAVELWDSAGEQIQAVIDDVGDINNELTGLRNFTNVAFKDGILDMAEREALRTHIEQLNNEKSDIDAKYNQIYADTYLTGTTKTNLSTAKTNVTTGYDKAHSDLISFINTAVADSVVTSLEKTNVDNAFVTYRTRLSTLSTRFEEAIRAIEQAKADKAESDSSTYTDGKDNQTRTDLRLTSPLPTSVSLNSSGITATTTGDATKFARLDYRGLYVQGGAIDIRTSATTNRGVVLDANGLRAYNNSGVQTFSIDVNGNATFSGTLSGASGNFSGTLSGANITGATGTFSGTLSGATISGGTINVTSDVKVGTYLEVGASSTTAHVSFTNGLNSPSIYGDNNDLMIIKNSTFRIDTSTRMFFSNSPVLDFTNLSSITWGSHAPSSVTYATTAGNANQLGGVAPSGYSTSGHNHSGVYAPVSHNHDSLYSTTGHVHADNQYVKPYTTQALKLWRSATKVRVYEGASYTELTGVSV